MARDCWFLVMGAPNPPRGQSMSGNLSALDTARAGLLGVIAADYHLAAFAPVSSSLLISWRAPRRQPLPWRPATRAVPAGRLNRGEIAIGQRADLVAVEPGDGHRIRATFRGGQFIYSDGTLHPLQALAA